MQTPKKVSNACHRCRRQKLKCDVQRPCTLCTRAGVNCQGPATSPWRVYGPGSGQSGSRVRQARRSTRSRPAPESPKPGSDGLTRDDSHGHDTASPAPVALTRTERLNPGDEPLHSSSTMSLVDGAFQFHSSDVPETDALPGSPAQDSRSTRRQPMIEIPQSTMTELLSLFPKREVAALLVDTYFDRVHWFMLLFHQEDFRQRWQQAYQYSTEQLTKNSQNAGFISTFLMVLAIGLQYAGEHRKSLLEAYGVDQYLLRDDILNTIRTKLLDIVSLGSLEAAQTCVLLGTYYLYHGNPGLAWPVCGCGLRIAQALNLHRKLPLHSPSMTVEMYQQYETRKRCWWAIYEIETFCSMSYGYPHSVKDSDCDIELLDPLSRTTTGHSPTSLDECQQCSLLSYKYFMSKLAVLTKSILTELYGISQDKTNYPKSSSDLHRLAQKVAELDTRLRQWKDNIPPRLQLDSANPPAPTYNSVEEMDQDIGASGPGFENHIYQLQALALALAYENARILVHRPLLSYKMITRNPDSTGDSHMSLQACRDAALSTSGLGLMPIFTLASDTYATAFIGMHTFTAGVTVCILASIEPLTLQSQQSKIGLNQLMSMQMSLKTKSGFAAQGVDILKRLTTLVMKKEMQEILNPRREQPPQRMDEVAEPAPETGNDVFPELNENIPFDYVEDPAMSQALYDFDQAISTDVPNELTEGALFSDTLGTQGFAQEQAWIWGFDNLINFNGDNNSL